MTPVSRRMHGMAPSNTSVSAASPANTARRWTRDLLHEAFGGALYPTQNAEVLPLQAEIDEPTEEVKACEALLVYMATERQLRHASYCRLVKSGLHPNVPAPHRRHHARRQPGGRVWAQGMGGSELVSVSAACVCCCTRRVGLLRTLEPGPHVVIPSV
jgi:hypothetical protein